MLKTLAHAGAMALVLMLAPVAALAAVVDMPPAAFGVADTAAISFAPLAEYLIGIAALLMPLVIGAGLKLLADKLKIDRKASAMMELEAMANKAMLAGKDVLHRHAANLTIKVDNPTVGAVAGYIVHQAPKLLRDADMDEAQVAAWIGRITGGPARMAAKDTDG